MKIGFDFSLYMMGFSRLESFFLSYVLRNFLYATLEYTQKDLKQQFFMTCLDK